MLQSVPPIIKFCTYTVPEDNNRFFTRRPPTTLYLSLGPTVFFDSPNEFDQNIIFFVSQDFPLCKGVDQSFSFYLFSDFRKV